MIKTDLHKAKKSHLTVPALHGIEVHLEDKDVKNVGKLKRGDKTHFRIPMEVTSKDPGHTRFKQNGKPKVEKIVNKMFKLKRK